MADTHTHTHTHPHTQNGSHKSYVAPEHIKCVQSELVLSVKIYTGFLVHKKECKLYNNLFLLFITILFKNVKLYMWFVLCLHLIALIVPKEIN